MKKSLIILFLFLSLVGVSQQNTLSGIFAANDLAIGVKYDRHIYNSHNGYYGSFRYGSYNAPECGRIVHYKGSIGYTAYMIGEDEYNVKFNLGLVGHHYKILEEGYEEVSNFTLFPASIELGVGCIIRRFNSGFTYDPFKKDVEMLFGWSF
jgi:hypothetical protein